MTGTEINYYFVCRRKLWLFAHRIDMEQNSEAVALGKHISDVAYKREEHDIKIGTGEDDIVLDFFDNRNKIIHEVKKSDKMEDVHIWQVKYYISVLEKKGILGVIGEIDYPRLKRKLKVELSEEDRKELESLRSKIQIVITEGRPPGVINASFCKSCSYYDLCYV